MIPKTQYAARKGGMLAAKIKNRLLMTKMKLGPQMSVNTRLSFRIYRRVERRVYESRKSASVNSVKPTLHPLNYSYVRQNTTQHHRYCRQSQTKLLASLVACMRAYHSLHYPPRAWVGERVSEGEAIVALLRSNYYQCAYTFTRPCVRWWR
jgi:hypothetical protein